MLYKLAIFNAVFSLYCIYCWPFILKGWRKRIMMLRQIYGTGSTVWENSVLDQRNFYEIKLQTDSFHPHFQPRQFKGFRWTGFDLYIVLRHNVGWKSLAWSKIRSISGGQITSALHHSISRVAYFSRLIYFTCVIEWNKQIKINLKSVTPVIIDFNS